MHILILPALHVCFKAMVFYDKHNVSQASLLLRILFQFLFLFQLYRPSVMIPEHSGPEISPFGWSDIVSSFI